MTTLKSYDLNGKKLSFANWVSNLSPTDTPFTAMTRKESVDETTFSWQSDLLEPPEINAMMEASVADSKKLASTYLGNNTTQILRKVVAITDTAEAVDTFGIKSQVQYHLTQATIELKRDLEWAFLHNRDAEYAEVGGKGRQTAGFASLVAEENKAEASTGAVVHFQSTTSKSFKEDDIRKMTYNLYLAGSSADTIMAHPRWALVFAQAQEVRNSRARIFENTPKIAIEVSAFTDSFGKDYKIIYNRFMPEDMIYFFNPSDWTQMLLRPPAKTMLPKKTSVERWMVEMEVGLRHKNPYSSGVLIIKDMDYRTACSGVANEAFNMLKNSTDNLGAWIELTHGGV